MQAQIAVNYPEFLAHSLNMRNGEFEREIKTLSLVKLFELGKISSGMAAKTLGLSRLDFLELLGRYNVSPLSGPDTLEADALNAQRLYGTVAIPEAVYAEIIIDKERGRRYAEQFNLRLTGVVGVLLRAKEKGLIPAVTPLLEELVRHGIWLSRSLIEKARALARE